MNLIINAYREGYVNEILSDPQNVRVVQLWIDNHPGLVAHSPMLNDLINRVYHLNSDIESKILSGRFHELTSQELVKNLELIQMHLELKTLDFEMILPLLLDKLPTEDLIAVLSSYLTEESIQRLSNSQILRLSALSNMSLPPFAENFRQILQTNGFDNIKRLTGLTEEEKDAALALYIEHHKISLCNIRLTDAEFLRLAPHLRYIDLKGFLNIPLAQELLQKCSNLNVLLINDGEMLEKVSSLPLCKKLNCGTGTNLSSLPDLPLCKELECSNCKFLEALPALPLCEKLHCHDCSYLQALPELPLCKELDCYGCRNLLALPELPLCNSLNCNDCTKLKALPALLHCKTLYCSDCTTLRALNELPLCERLFCGNCYNLPALPALPLCKDLNCHACTNLQALPALPLCEMLHCKGCTNLTTLPLSFGQNERLTYIDIDGTGIEPAVVEAILTQCRLIRNAEAVKILPSCLAKWKAIAKSDANLDLTALSVDQKKTLNEWLLRLERTQDFSRSQSLLANTVCNILVDLLKNREFQELFFPQAEANNSCCEDRAAMSLNEIYTSWMMMCKSGNLQMLTGVARTLCLRKELQKLIGDEGESVEIFLYYESTLRERLGLETAIQNMTYGDIGKRNWINVDQLVEDVEAHFFEELFEFPAFERKIVFDDSEFADKLEALGEYPKGDPNDESVLNYQHRQGEIMQEWKREKMRAAKRWYKENI